MELGSVTMKSLRSRLRIYRVNRSWGVDRLTAIRYALHTKFYEGEMAGIVAIVDLFPESEETKAEFLDEATEFRYRQMAYGADFWKSL